MLHDLIMAIKYRLHVCQQYGCWSRDTTACFLPDPDASEKDRDIPDYYYCSEHAHGQGFCWSCGQFWGGIESFDFGYGICENCEADWNEDLGEWYEFDDDLVEWDGCVEWGG